MKLDITIDDAALRVAMKAVPRETLAAAKAAMRRTAQGVSTELRKQMRAVSYLKAGTARKSLLKPIFRNGANSVEAELRVKDDQLPADDFKFRPKSITAQKEKRPQQWKEPEYRLGPNEPWRKASQNEHGTRGFLIKLKNNKWILSQRSPVLATSNRRKGKGKKDKPYHKMMRVFGYSPQYFAAFASVRGAVKAKAHEVFPRRLKHELYRRLGRLA